MTFEALSNDVIICDRDQDFGFSIPTGRAGEDLITDWIHIPL